MSARPWHGRASLCTRESLPAANSGTYLYSVVRETPNSFAIEVTVFPGCASRARACRICSGFIAGGSLMRSPRACRLQALVGALHDELADELRERCEHVEDEATPGEWC